MGLFKFGVFATFFLLVSCGDGLNNEAPSDNSDNVLEDFGIRQALRDDDKTSNRLYFPVGDDRKAIPYFRNVALSNLPNLNSVDDVIIAVHGSAHRAGLAYRAVMNSCGNPCNPNSSEFNTLVLAPQYMGPEELAEDYNNDPELLSWGYGWKIGHLSRETDGGSKITAFSIMDRIISTIYNSNENARIKLIGHSAGGQFVSRYAAISRGQVDDVRFIVTNPSTHLYLTPTRPHPSPNCDRVNEYRYGVDDLRADLWYQKSDFTPNAFLRREVHVLIGQEDVQTSYLDVDCRANTHGANRYERAVNYYEIHKSEFDAPNLFLHEVPGVGHSSSGTYGSQQGRRLLFSNQPFAEQSLDSTETERSGSQTNDDTTDDTQDPPSTGTGAIPVTSARDDNPCSALDIGTKVLFAGEERTLSQRLGTDDYPWYNFDAPVEGIWGIPCKAN